MRSGQGSTAAEPTLLPDCDDGVTRGGRGTKLTYLHVRDEGRLGGHRGPSDGGETGVPLTGASEETLRWRDREKCPPKAGGRSREAGPRAQDGPETTFMGRKEAPGCSGRKMACSLREGRPAVMAQHGLTEEVDAFQRKTRLSVVLWQREMFPETVDRIRGPVRGISMSGRRQE